MLGALGREKYAKVKQSCSNDVVNVTLFRWRSTLRHKANSTPLQGQACKAWTSDQPPPPAASEGDASGNSTSTS
jgi:hypothetical protein